MKKLLYLLSALVLTLTSCSDEDDTTNASSEILLTRMIETYDGGSPLTTNFIYNGNKLVEWNDSEGERETFVYNSSGKLISGIESYDDGAESGEVIYSHDSSGRLTRIDYELDGLYFTYTYNSNGTVTEAQYDEFDDQLDSYILTISNDNLVSQVGTGVSTGDSYASTFDSSNSPFVNIYEPHMFFKIYFDANRNNAVSRIHNENTSSSSSSTSTFTFNSDGYPTSETLTYGDGRVETVQYFYN